MFTRYDLRTVSRMLDVRKSTRPNPPLRVETSIFLPVTKYKPSITRVKLQSCCKNVYGRISLKYTVRNRLIIR